MPESRYDINGNLKVSKNYSETNCLNGKRAESNTKCLGGVTVPNLTSHDDSGMYNSWISLLHKIRNHT